MYDFGTQNICEGRTKLALEELCDDFLVEGGGVLVWSLIVGLYISIYIVIKTFERF